jgi:ATP/maltotriose-dependent transcriptional regulator MalT
MPEQIIQSRIIPRKAPQGILVRSRLNNHLFENLRCNFIIISSPAGYGKTTFVQNFFESYKIKYGWMYCSADINNFDIFLSYLVHSIKNIENTFGEKIIESLNSLEGTQELKKDFQSIIPALVGTFCNDFINTFKEDVYVVLLVRHCKLFLFLLSCATGCSTITNIMLN